MTPNGQLAHELNLQLMQTRMAFRQVIQRLLKERSACMTFEMLEVMHRLRMMQGVSQQHLAENTSRDKACLTSLINNLEKKGWVERREDPSDRRTRLIFLTDEGIAMSDRIRFLLAEVYDRIGAKMTPRQMQECRKQLEKMNGILDGI